MLVIKPITALAIVLFAQVNVFSYNFFSLKNVEMKLEKDAKKMVISPRAKQSMSRFSDGNKMVVKKKLVKKFEPDSLFFIPLNFSVAFENAVRIEAQELRLVWFGCCHSVS